MSSAHAQQPSQSPGLPDEFAQGVRAFNAGQLTDAQRIWEQLLEQYPQRPELLNNMAVLRIKNGDRDQAFYLLSRAVRNPPFYASIAANWQKFSTASDTLPELSLIQAWPRSGQVVPLLPPPEESEQPSPLRALLEEAILAEERRLTDMKAELAGRPNPAAVLANAAAVADVAALPAQKSAAPVVASRAPKAVEPLAIAARSQPLASASNGDEITLADPALEQALKQWMLSWQKRDIEGYLKWYGAAFKPADSLNRAQWEKLRRSRLAAAQKIELQVRVIKAEAGPLPDSQWLQVIQHYRSRVFQDVSNKSMLWRKSAEGWVILRELTGPPVFAD